jgi:hypothetical protein
MRVLLVATFALCVSVEALAEEESTFRAYVDSEICARLMLGPISPARITCSQRTSSEGAGPVLVRLSNNMVLTVNNPKTIHPLAGQLVEVSGELKTTQGTLRLGSIHPIKAEAVPQGPERRLTDPQVYNSAANPKLYEQIRFQLARLPYVTDYDFISFTLNGSDVILTGWTVREVNRTSANNLVKGIRGVESVVNNIELLSSLRGDYDLRYATRVALRQKLPNYFFNGASDIRIIVKNQTIILVGVVKSRDDFDIASRECNMLPFVFKVFNMLQVRP